MRSGHNQRATRLRLLSMVLSDRYQRLAERATVELGSVEPRCEIGAGRGLRMHYQPYPLAVRLSEVRVGFLLRISRNQSSTTSARRLVPRVISADSNKTRSIDSTQTGACPYSDNRSFPSMALTDTHVARRGQVHPSIMNVHRRGKEAYDFWRAYRRVQHRR